MKYREYVKWLFRPRVSVFKAIMRFFLFGVMPLIIVLCVLAINNTTSSAQIVLDGWQRDVDQTLQDMSESLFNTNQWVRSLTNSTKISYLTYVPTYISPFERGDVVATLNKNCSYIRECSPFVGNIQIFLREIGCEVGTLNYYREFDAGEYDEMAKRFKAYNQDVLVNDGKDIVFQLSPFYYTSEPACIIRVTVPQKTIHKYFYDLLDAQAGLYTFTMGDLAPVTNIENEKCAEKINACTEPIQRIMLNGRIWYVFTSYEKNYDMVFRGAVPATKILALHYQMLAFTMAVAVLLTIFVVIFILIVRHIIHKPMTTLVNAFQSVEKGNFSVRIQEPGPSEFDYLYKQFNQMISMVDDLVNQTYKQEILRRRAELKQLQAQINPHFLNNSYFMLQRMLQQGQYEESIRVSEKLGVYFRYITRSKEDYVTLHDEVQHAQSYCDIQALRFEDRITVEFGALPEEISGVIVPKLIVQPLIENAFNHGLDNVLEGGLLRVSFRNNDGTVEIMVEENGDELSDEQLEKLEKDIEDAQDSQTGGELSALFNISNRLNLFYQNGSRLTVARSALGGMLACIIIYPK